MECRPLDVTLISATDLKNVNLLSKMDVYAVVSLSGDPASKHKTPVDKDSGPNPKWNHTVRLTVPEAPAKQGQLYLKVKIVSDRSFGDKEIGEVQIPIGELLESSGDGKGEQRVSYSVRLPNGKAKGTLNLAYKFGEKFTAPAPEIPKAAPPVMAYPPPGHAGPSYAYPPPGAYGHAPPPPAGQPMHAYAYAPPPAGYGYAQPPPPGYGYAQPPPPGYGYAVAPPQKPKKNGGKMALGLGAGLLGGLLIGDMVSDVAEMDAGFGDAGFDF